jgi:hypothetical protein
LEHSSLSQASTRALLCCLLFSSSFGASLRLQPSSKWVSVRKCKYNDLIYCVRLVAKEEEKEKGGEKPRRKWSRETIAV